MLFIYLVFFDGQGGYFMRHCMILSSWENCVDEVIEVFLFFCFLKSN